WGAPAGARLGIVCAGKTYFDVLQAFADLGVGAHGLAALGVRVLRLAVTYPLGRETVVEFARSVDELVVIEEKRPFVETQLRAIRPGGGVAPPAAGKRDPAARPWAPPGGGLDAAKVAAVLPGVLPDRPPPNPPNPATAPNAANAATTPASGAANGSPPR